MVVISNVCHITIVKLETDSVVNGCSLIDGKDLYFCSSISKNVYNINRPILLIKLRIVQKTSQLLITCSFIIIRIVHKDSAQSAYSTPVCYIRHAGGYSLLFQEQGSRGSLPE